MIKIKKDSSARFEHFGKISPKLGKVFFDVVKYLALAGHKDVVITSIIRPKKDDSGVHEEGRAMDISCTFSDEIGDDMMYWINMHYQYDKNRPQLKTIIRHLTENYDDPGMHYHLQVMKEALDG